jgi:hypothetical protein
MDRGLGEFHVESQRRGRRNIRATSEMVWALEAIPGTELLMVYESRLNHFIPGKPWINICLYNLANELLLLMSALTQVGSGERAVPPEDA